MFNCFSKPVTGVLLTIITTLNSIFGVIGLKPIDVEVPTYTELETREQIEFDEGEFSLSEYDIIVSPNGNDSNDGSMQNPLKTLSGAKEKAKNLKGTAEKITVWFHEGTYVFDDTVSFDNTDFSGITYRSFPNEKVVFSGAKEYSQWTEATVNGVRCFVCDANVTDKTFFNSAFKGEQRLSRPTWPKNGQFAVASVDLNDAADPEQPYFKIQNSFNANKKDVISFKNIHDVDVRILHYWCDELLPIDTVDTNTGKITVEKPASMTICKDDRFFYENVFEALSEPGEWYLDREDNKLYYIPQDGDTTDNTVIKAAYLEQLIDINNCKNICFEGIDFTDTDWETVSGNHFSSIVTQGLSDIVNNAKYKPNFPQAAYDISGVITIRNSDNINFTNCLFTRTGNAGVMFDECCKNCNVTSCELCDIGANGIYIRGINTENESKQSSNINVTDCNIHKYGQIYNNAVGVLYINVKDSEISQNEIYDGLYTAISVGWVWGYTFNVTNNIKIKNNLIYDIGQGWLSDMGGIYTLGMQPDTEISGNVIHNVGCYEGDSGYGGWGIYLDEGSSGIDVFNNLCYDCSSEGFHMHYGADNIVTNNIFALNDEAQFRLSRQEDHSALTLDTNILLSNNAPMYYTIYSDSFDDNNNFYWDLKRGKNVLSGTSMKLFDRISKAKCKIKGFYNNAHFEDPLFRDPLNYDFTIADNSPVIEAGFKLWNYNDAGTITKFN